MTYREIMKNMIDIMIKRDLLLKYNTITKILVNYLHNLRRLIPDDTVHLSHTH